MNSRIFRILLPRPFLKNKQTKKQPGLVTETRTGSFRAAERVKVTEDIANLETVQWAQRSCTHPDCFTCGNPARLYFEKFKLILNMQN